MEVSETFNLIHPQRLLSVHRLPSKSVHKDMKTDIFAIQSNGMQAYCVCLQYTDPFSDSLHYCSSPRHGHHFHLFIYLIIV